jgi:hypothetical protein
VAKLVKIVSSQGMWYEEILQEEAAALEEAFGSNFEVSVEQVVDVFDQTDVLFGTTVKPEEINPQDIIIGTCYL